MQWWSVVVFCWQSEHREIPFAPSSWKDEEDFSVCLLVLFFSFIFPCPFCLEKRFYRHGKITTPWNANIEHNVEYKAKREAEHVQSEARSIPLAGARAVHDKFTDKVVNVIQYQSKKYRYQSEWEPYELTINILVQYNHDLNCTCQWSISTCR